MDRKKIADEVVGQLNEVIDAVRRLQADPTDDRAFGTIEGLTDRYWHKLVLGPNELAYLLSVCRECSTRLDRAGNCPDCTTQVTPARPQSGDRSETLCEVREHYAPDDKCHFDAEAGLWVCDDCRERLRTEPPDTESPVTALYRGGEKS